MGFSFFDKLSRKVERFASKVEDFSADADDFLDEVKENISSAHETVTSEIQEFAADVQEDVSSAHGRLTSEVREWVADVRATDEDGLNFANLAADPLPPEDAVEVIVPSASPTENLVEHSMPQGYSSPLSLALIGGVFDSAYGAASDVLSLS